MNQLRRAPRVLFLAIALAVAAFSGVIDLTSPPGPSLDPDALAYLGAGASLAHGHGLRVPSASWASTDSTAPLVHFPPGFPAAIALGVAAGASPVNAARFVEAIAGAVTVLAFVMTANFAGGILGALAVTAIVTFTPAIVLVHAGILSDPLFLALLMLFTWRMTREASGTGRGRTLTLGALAAAATLVRYAGAALVLATIVEAWWTLEGPWRATWRKRLRRAVVAAELPVVVLAIWVFTRPHSDGAEKIRELGIYTKGFGATLAGGLDTFARWLAPGINSDLARTMTAIVVLMAAWTLVVRTFRAALRGAMTERERRLYRSTAIILLSYFVFIMASRLFADPGIPFDDRILAPVFVLVAMRFGVALAAFLRASFFVHRGFALITIGIVASWMWGAEEVSMGLVDDFHSDGGDLAGHEWTASPLVAWAGAAPPGTVLYSNWPSAIWFHTSRATHELPEELDSSTVREFREKIEREHGAVLAFKVQADDYASPDSLARLAQLVPLEQWPDGTIWRAPADVPPPAGAARPDSARLHP